MAGSLLSLSLEWTQGVSVPSLVPPLMVFLRGESMTRRVEQDWMAKPSRTEPSVWQEKIPSVL